MANETIFDSSEQSQNQTNQNQNQGQGSSRGPVARIKASPLTIAVFEDDNGMRSYKLQRAYTQDDGQSFNYTESMRARDLRKAARLFEKAADAEEGVEVEQLRE